MSEPAFTITVYDKTVGQDVLDEAVELYRGVYAEPPYFEGEAECTDFAEGLLSRAEQESFRLVIARLAADPIGFAIGHELPKSTRWWEGALTPLPEAVTTDRSGRTFAVIELAVVNDRRRVGLGGRLHEHLTVGLQADRLTLLVRPDAEPARAAYSRWGYYDVGQIRPFPGAPVYDAMLLVRPWQQTVGPLV